MTLRGPIAVIEIGGRAIRLLVAEIQSGPRLQVVGTAWSEVALANVIDGEDSEITKRLEKIADVLKSFRTRAQQLGAAQIIVYGTEAVRGLDSNQLKELRIAAPELQVLSKKDEAELSLITGAMSLPEVATNLKNLMVVDQGSGSMEISIGEITAMGVGIRVAAYKSYKLGTRELVDLLRSEGGSLSRLRSLLEERFSRYKRLELRSSGRPIVLGSAATKIAWFGVRQNLIDRYDSRMVNGRIIPIRLIESFIRTAESDVDGARKFIDPKNPSSDEFETITAGLVGLEAFLKREEKSDFVVCGYGTRHGLVWKNSLASL